MDMRAYLSFIACGLACGGASGPPIDGGTDGGADTSTTDGGDAAPVDSSADVNNGDGAACPDEHGKYAVTFTGQGCGTISNSAPICVSETSCTITLATTGTGPNELSGMTPIGGDGSFSNAAMNEGAMSRTGCVGTWNSGATTLTIDCGGVNTSQSCEAVLVLIGGTCN
jgi:hypothetical protein